MKPAVGPFSLSLQKNACQIVKGNRIFCRLEEAYWFSETKELIQLVWKGHTKLRNMKGLHFTEWAHLKVGLESQPSRGTASSSECFSVLQATGFSIRLIGGAWSPSLMIYANKDSVVRLIWDGVKSKSHLQFGPRKKHIMLYAFSFFFPADNFLIMFFLG